MVHRFRRTTAAVRVSERKRETSYMTGIGVSMTQHKGWRREVGKSKHDEQQSQDLPGLIG